jgi:hypothetical protein
MSIPMRELPDQEPKRMRLSAVCQAPAGSVQLRDVWAWHGSTPNISDDVRWIPNIELYSRGSTFRSNQAFPAADYRNCPNTANESPVSVSRTHQKN